jgi:hypothetical protein
MEGQSLRVTAALIDLIACKGSKTVSFGLQARPSNHFRDLGFRGHRRASRFDRKFRRNAFDSVRIRRSRLSVERLFARVVQDVQSNQAGVQIPLARSVLHVA